MNKIIIQKYTLVLTDIFAILVSYYLSTLICNYIRGDNYHQINLSHLSVVKVMDAMFLIVLFWQKQLYFKRRPNWSEVYIIYKQLLVLLFVNLPVLFIGVHSRTTLMIFILFWLLVFVVIPLFRSLSKLVLDNIGVWKRDLYIIGVGADAIEGYHLLGDSNLFGYKVCGFVDLKSLTNQLVIENKIFPVLTLNELKTKPKTSEILICLDDRYLSSHVKLINKLQQLFLSVMILPQMHGLPLYGMEVNHFFGNEKLLLRLENNLSSRFNRLIKMIFDCLFTALCLPFLFVILLLVSILIFLEDRGNPFFIQQRVGRGGKQFGCIKFRTMSKNAEQILETWKNHNDPIYLEYIANNYKLINDPRVTRIGKFLRKTSLDELPQILNVMQLKMSLVGPRPLIPSEVDEYPDGLFYYEQVNPGITGLWQISGRSKTSFKERCRLDSWYIKNWSLWYDVVILIKTIVVVFKRDGAY